MPAVYSLFQKGTYFIQISFHGNILSVNLLMSTDICMEAAEDTDKSAVMYDTSTLSHLECCACKHGYCQHEWPKKKDAVLRLLGGDITQGKCDVPGI